MQYLIAKGHKEIGCITGVLDKLTAQQQAVDTLLDKINSKLDDNRVIQLEPTLVERDSVKEIN